MHDITIQKTNFYLKCVSILKPLPTTIHFTHELCDIYSQHVHAHLSALDPSLPLESLTTELTHILHSATINSFPYTKYSNQGRVGSMPQTRWYDEDCRNLHRQLKVSQLGGTITAIQARKEKRKMARHKRRVWETSQYWELYHMLMSSDCATAWRRLREPTPQTPIEDPNTRHTYTKSPYQVPNQPPIRMPSTPRPTMGTFYTTSRVTKIRKKLQHRKAMDHTGLRAEHIVYAWECLTPFLTLIFNRALAEGFPP